MSKECIELYKIGFALSCAIIFGAVGDLLLSNGMQSTGRDISAPPEGHSSRHKADIR